MIGGGKRELPQSNFTRSRMQVFSLLSACKWIIFLSLLFSAILYLPTRFVSSIELRTPTAPSRTLPMKCRKKQRAPA